MWSSLNKIRNTFCFSANLFPKGVESIYLTILFVDVMLSAADNWRYILWIHATDNASEKPTYTVASDRARCVRNVAKVPTPDVASFPHSSPMFLRDVIPLVCFVICSDLVIRGIVKREGLCPPQVIGIVSKWNPKKLPPLYLWNNWIKAKKRVRKTAWSEKSVKICGLNIDTKIEQFLHIWSEGRKNMACASATTGSNMEVVAPTNVSVATRPSRFTMEGVGSRVIRGPDWKWGKQVSAHLTTIREPFLCRSNEGWILWRKAWKFRCTYTHHKLEKVLWWIMLVAYKTEDSNWKWFSLINGNPF